MRYKLYLRQAGNGCDYMIGCGSTMIDLNATTKEKAIKEAKRQIKESTHSECEIEEALLIESFEDLSNIGEEVVQERDAEIQKAAIAEKRRQLKKLKEELGEE